MKGIGLILSAFIALALFTAAVRVLVLCLIVLLLLAFVKSPRETFGCSLGLILLGLLGSHPVPMISLVVALGVLAVMGRHWK